MMRKKPAPLALLYLSIMSATEAQSQFTEMPYEGTDLMRDLNDLATLDSVEFDKKCAALAERWLQTHSVSQIAENDKPYQSFIKSLVPGVGEPHHIHSHPEYHGDKELFIRLREAYLKLHKGSIEALEALSYIDASKTKVEVVTDYGPAPPNNNKVSFMMTLSGDPRPQNACPVDFDQCHVARRHATDIPGSGQPALVTFEPSPYSTNEVSATAWCAVSYYKKDGEWRPKFKMHQPGTACFTGIPIGSNFNPLVAIPGYVRDQALELLDTRRDTLRTKIATFVEASQLWALSIA